MLPGTARQNNSSSGETGIRQLLLGIFRLLVVGIYSPSVDQIFTATAEGAFAKTPRILLPSRLILLSRRAAATCKVELHEPDPTNADLI